MNGGKRKRPGQGGVPREPLGCGGIGLSVAHLGADVKQAVERSTWMAAL